MDILSRIFGKESSSPRHGGPDMISLVALAPTWQPRSIDDVRRELDEIFPGEYLPPRSEGNFVVEGFAEGASYMVQCTIPKYAGMFQIYNVPSPYSAFSDYLRHIKDPETRRLADSQGCWLSVDLMHTYATNEDAYRFISLALGKLAPEDTTLLVHPSRNQIAKFTRELRAKLVTGGEPFGTA